MFFSSRLKNAGPTF